MFLYPFNRVVGCMENSAYSDPSAPSESMISPSMSRDRLRLHEIRVGELRGNEPMRIVSGPHQRERVHYVAAPRKTLQQEWKHSSLGSTTSRVSSMA